MRWRWGPTTPPPAHFAPIATGFLHFATATDAELTEIEDVIINFRSQ
jgi:hypothetical protein